MSKIENDTADSTLILIGLIMISAHLITYSKITKNNQPATPSVVPGFNRGQIDKFLIRTRMPVKLLASSLGRKSMKNAPVMD